MVEKTYIAADGRTLEFSGEYNEYGLKNRYYDLTINIKRYTENSVEKNFSIKYTVRENCLIYGKKEDRFYLPDGKAMANLYENEFDDFIRHFDILPPHLVFDSVKKEKIYFLKKGAGIIGYFPVYTCFSKNIPDFSVDYAPYDIVYKNKDSVQLCPLVPASIMKQYHKLPKKLRGGYISENEKMFIRQETIDNSTIFTDLYSNVNYKVSHDKIYIDENLMYRADKSEEFSFSQMMKKYIHQYIQNNVLT